MGIEKAVFCRICGHKYFPVSLPFHQRVCVKIFSLTHTDCTYCKRAVHNTDWTEHVHLCKKLPQKGTGAGKSVIATLASIGYGIGGADSNGRHACQVCGRKFTLDRVSTHENVCRRRLAAGTIQIGGSVTSDSHSVAPKKGAKVVTLTGMSRPKSKQQGKQMMPSLKSRIEQSQTSSKRRPEVKPF